MRIHGEYVIIPQTRYTRAVTFRWDRFGIYLLFWEDDHMAAGCCFQYPEFITKNCHFTPGYSSFSYSPETIKQQRDYYNE